MSSLIHTTAVIESGANLGRDISVGPFAVIEKGAEIGDGVVLESHAVVKKWARIGDNVRVGHFCVVGGDPQHLDFDCEIESFVSIGQGSRLGEGVTVHRSMYEHKVTKVGESSFLMGNSHVAHDSNLAQQVILANGVLLGGHVEIGKDVFVGGGAGVHQFVRIGPGAMIGGLAEISKDVGPNLLVMGRNRACGLNHVGMKRRGVSDEDMRSLKRLFRDLLTRPVPISKLAQERMNELNEDSSSTVREFLSFFISGKRGFATCPRKS